jgi:hypothetical protein
MGIETQPGDVYRLIVVLGTHVVEADDSRSDRFERTQARVAEAVCRYARSGPVHAVALQRGRRHTPPSPGRSGSTAAVNLDDREYDWAIEKRWGADVIRRILVQDEIEPPTTVSAQRADGKPAPRPTPRPGNTGRARRPRPINKHKSMRWHLTATVAVVILAVIALILFQTGGHPLRLLSAVTAAKPSVKDELPFDARTSFTPQPRPGGAHKPLGQPQSEDSIPDGQAQP